MSAAEAIVSVARCPICGGEADALHDLQHTQTWRCRSPHCAHAFAAPQLDDAALGEAYRAHYYPDEGAPVRFEDTPSEILEELVAALAATLGNRPDARLLDFGCGRGALAGVAMERGFHAVGVEADSGARAIASRRSELAVFEDLARLHDAEPAARFDAIVLWQVIEHLREPRYELEKLRDLLLPEGLLVIATPNAECLKARLARGAWENFANPTHLHYFSERSLGRLLASCGLALAERLQLPRVHPHHGLWRRHFQRWLRARGLDGDLLVVARRDGS